MVAMTASDTDLESHIKLAELVLRQIDAQQEVRDRWFRYYLLITAGTLTFVTSVLKLFEHTLPHRVLYLSVAGALVLAGSLGFCFFNIYLRQRRNYSNHYRLLMVVHETIISKVVMEPYESFYPRGRPFERQPKGADYYTLYVHVLLGCAYFGAACGALQAAYQSVSYRSVLIALLGTVAAAAGFTYTSWRYDATAQQ